jgi:hypothetical protein
MGAYCAFLSRGPAHYSTSSANLHLTTASNFLVWGQISGLMASPFGFRLLELRRNRVHSAFSNRVRGEQTIQLKSIRRMPRFVTPDEFKDKWLRTATIWTAIQMG